MLAPPSNRQATTADERRLVLIVAAVQFVNVLDFMIVMPMGPDFARGLGIPVSSVGIVGGSYTMAAALAGFAGSFFLDRFDRRKALALALAGLVCSTAAAGLSIGLVTLVLARVVAGLFGGPATSLAVAAVTDTVPPERRGRAMGTVMTAFSVASVAGVPAGLELSRLFGWRATFLCVAALGLLVNALALFMMPPMRAHLRVHSTEPHQRKNTTPVLADPLARLALTATFLTTLGVFAIVPNLAAFVQFNRHYPREHLGMLYFVGGVASFIALRFVGKLADRFGATRLVLVGTALHAAALALGIIFPRPSLGVLAFFVCYMLSGSFRMVPNGALFTRVPGPEQRARFMSTQSAVQHTGAALGAMLGAAFLIELPSGALQNLDLIAEAALIAALAVPLLTASVERGVRLREAGARHHPT